MSESRNHNAEVDFREYIEIVVKKKKIILSVVFLTVIISAIFLFFLSKTYESKAIIQSGNLNGPVIPYSEVETLIKSRPFLNPIFNKLGVSFRDEELKDMIVLENIKDSSFFIIRIRAKDSNLVYLLRKEIVNSYLAYGKSIYEKQNCLLNDQKNKLDDLIENTKVSLERIKNINKDNSLPLFLPDPRVQLKDLYEQKVALELQMAVAKEFKIIDESNVSAYPIGPSKGKTILIAGIISMFFAIFYVLMSDN